MKKIFLSLIMFVSAGVAVGVAQTMYDALDLGKDNYYGTARTLGMGNAVTAIGGDLGSVALNPAGSAVAGYSQFTISQGLAISSTNSSWAPGYSEYDGSQTFSGSTKANKLRYIMPNVGFNLRMETGEKSGIKSWNFAFMSTMTNNYLDNAYATGYNALGSNPRYTSMAGSFAAGAQFNSDGAGSMLDPDILTWKDPYNTPNRNGYYDRWQYITAYKGGMINYNWTTATGDAFYGANEYKDGPYFLLDDNGDKIPLVDENNNPLLDENGDQIYAQAYNFYVPGRLNQSSRRIRTGSKNDLTTNIGFNLNDRFYFGFNLNIPIISMRYNEVFTETPDNSDWPVWGTVTPERVLSDGDYMVFPETYFERVTYEYNYDADITGINVGAGFIWLPTRNLRIGASIKTPTAYAVEERLYMTAKTEYELAGNSYGQSPVGEFTYNFRSPWSVNAGLAYTFGRFGLVSADYQMTDYSVMRYSLQDDFTPDNPYAVVNDLMSRFCGVSHTLRLGAELRPVPFLALRAGYTLTTDPECWYYDSDGFLCDAYLYERDYDYYKSGQAKLLDKHYVDAPIHTASIGVGFVSTGSFYADLALRRTRSASYYSPYSTYVEATDASGNVLYDDNGTAYMVISPCTRAVRSLYDAVLTIGWRF